MLLTPSHRPQSHNDYNGQNSRWPPRSPPPGVHILYNSLSLSVGRTCRYNEWPLPQWGYITRQVAMGEPLCPSQPRDKESEECPPTGLKKANTCVANYQWEPLGKELKVASGSWAWSQPIASKKTETSVLQLQGNESCQQPVSWEDDPVPPRSQPLWPP